MKTKNLESILQSASEAEKKQIINQIKDISFSDYIHQLLENKQIGRAHV